MTKHWLNTNIDPTLMATVDETIFEARRSSIHISSLSFKTRTCSPCDSDECKSYDPDAPDD